MNFLGGEEAGCCCLLYDVAGLDCAAVQRCMCVWVCVCGGHSSEFCHVILDAHCVCVCVWVVFVCKRKGER